jgi:hypothetical protein
MPYRSSPGAIKICAGIAAVLVFALLLYAGVFDELIRSLGSAGYEFLRALNNE